jgi:hypothetical protein
LIVEDTVRSSIADHWHQDRAHNYRFFAPSKRLIEEEGILNFGLRFYPSRHLGDNRFELMLREIVCAYGWTQGLWETVRHSAINCAKAGVDGELRIATEQALNPSSRVYLGSELDSFGMRRPILEWQLSEIDRRTIQRAAVRFGETLARQGLGRVRLADWLFTEDAEFPGFAEGQEVGGHHHMCTTRMAESPSQGVVDKNQRVFGVDNLYLAGSSVFSTPGHMNPTFTIVQMTLRLADYLNAAPKE